MIRRAELGYTIVEVMIVLAVTGGLLVSIMASISGQQQKTEFTTSVRDFEQKIQDIVNDVDTGYFPTSGNFKCTNVSNAPIVSSSAFPQGTNQDCIFVGKLIHFAPQASPSGFTIYNLIGVRQFGTGPTPKVDVTDLTQANPRVLQFDDGTDISGASETGALYGTLEFRKIVNPPPVNTPLGYGLAIVSTFGSLSSVSSGSGTGATGLNLASLSSATARQDASSFKAGVNGASLATASNGVVICIGEQGGGRKAAILVGGKAQSGAEAMFDSDAAGAGC